VRDRFVNTRNLKKVMIAGHCFRFVTFSVNRS